VGVQRQVRQIGDTRTAIAAILKRPDGTVEDLTLLTLYFEMVSSKDVDKVAETTTNVTVTDATAGKVQYDPQAADVDTQGVFHAYFIAKDAAGRADSFPARRGHFEIVFMSRA